MNSHSYFESTPRSAVHQHYGIPPRGAHVRFSLFNLFTFKDGKIVEKRAHHNLADIMDQLTADSAA
ncbi:ester cyclase [Streptomyces clavifer]|uniref:ester cyclase n=1 Tax=Streptomyces clavifer TaxID=68188 RepID=UPI003798AFA5